ncbi:hypothetical protein AcV7_000293 [Taiwanofungus camphoratus]|nr:hypothetical protein AcV7_000293 [Antrodia cinnamomea]
MARATRSTVLQEKDKSVDTTPATRKSGSKKRKRTSIAENGDQPAAKQLRTDGSQEPDEHLEDPSRERPGSGDVPIQPSDAEKILEVLEMIDTQGLLDRVFPLPAETSDSTISETAPSPSAPTQSFSFRALLKDSSQYPLRVLRSAVQHLFPISSHPRSRPSPPAAQQLRFCNLALSLLDRASFHSSPLSFDVESIIASSADLDTQPPAETEDVKPSKATHVSTASTRKRKYALMQRLPTGDWWTSLSSDVGSPSADGRELKDMPTAHAELVAILPSASTSTSGSNVTLAAYAPKKTVQTLYAPPGPRHISCGRFLDYGPYTSFAPTFDQEGVEVGRDALAEVIWQREEKARTGRAKGKQKAVLETSVEEESDIVMLDDVQPAESEKSQSRKQKQKLQDSKLEVALEHLLPPEEVTAIKSALGSLELEQAVQELLDRSARALKRLEQLQLMRLGKDGGGSSTVEAGSEEWDVAQGISDSLALLASLRPRSSDDSTNPSLIPSESVLRKLHRTLPVDATQGWYGTLPEGRTTALRDDTTVQVKSGVPVPPAPATPVAPPTPATPAAKVAPPTTPYTPYTYSNYSAAQYRGGYGTYTPGQAGAYYPNYAPAQGQATTGTHYPNQQYSTAGQYSYPSWYNYQSAATTQNPAASTAGSTSGRATPQPVTPSTIPTNYASFFASATQQPQPQRAVANTVLSAAGTKAYQPNPWTGGQSQSGYVPPTLPPHLRPVVSGGSTRTPQPTTPGGTNYPAHSYYSSYQPTPSAAR